MSEADLLLGTRLCRANCKRLMRAVDSTGTEADTGREEEVGGADGRVLASGVGAAAGTGAREIGATVGAGHGSSSTRAAGRGRGGEAWHGERVSGAELWSEMRGGRGWSKGLVASVIST